MTLGYIVSGGIRIYITRNQDTAVPCPRLSFRRSRNGYNINFDATGFDLMTDD